MALADLLERTKKGPTPDEDNLDNESFFDDEDDFLEPDPQPARITDPKPAQKRVVSPRKAPTKAVQSGIRDTLVMMITLPSGVLAMKDEHCGGALLNQAEAIADAMLPIICRNPTMLAWFTTGGNYMDYIGLIMALVPVGQSIISHHITKTVGHENEGDEYDTVQYTAPVFS